MHPHEDKSLPLIVRNILARDHHEDRTGHSSYQDQSVRDRRVFEIQIATVMEEACPFWGGAVPFDGRVGQGITGRVMPRMKRYKAQYNIELAQDFTAMHGPEVGRRELVNCMTYEFMAEIERLIDGRDLKYYPCIVARPIATVDPNSFEPTFKFDTIFYLSKPFEFSFRNSPRVPVTRPRVGFCGHLMRFSDY